MAWTSNSAINAEATAGEPIKGSTVRKIQANISEAFAGASGAPALASSVAGAAYSGLPLDAVGMHRHIIFTQSSVSSVPLPPANAYMPGATYSAATLGLSAGTWMHLGGGYVGHDSVDLGTGAFNFTYYYPNHFVRVA
jgi:hypothetical protein